MRRTGWILALASLGMMLGLLAGDISNLNHWRDTLYPSFISGIMAHISAVIAAFVGGNLVPNMFKDSNSLNNNSDNNTVSQKKLQELNGGVKQ